MNSIKLGLKRIDKQIFRGNVYDYYTRHLKYRGKAYQLTSELYFPPHASSNKNIRLGSEGELLAIGGDLSPERVKLAWNNGIYPISFKNEPFLWWTSETHCVVILKDFHIRRNVRNFVQHETFRLTADQAYFDVINGCIESREEYTWLTPDRKRASYELFERGIGHSIEVWQNNMMIGGLFGVSWGLYFYPQSMFTRQNSGSKVAMTALALRLKEMNFAMLDFGIWPTENLMRYGAVMIAREDYLKLLEESVNAPDPCFEWRSLFENWDFKVAVKARLLEEQQNECKKIT